MTKEHVIKYVPKAARGRGRKASALPASITNVVIYVRISKWRDNETSTKTQEAECRRWAEAHGYTVLAVLFDEGISAYNGSNRPGLDKAMQLVMSGAAQALVVWKLSRFMRNASEFMKQWQKIDEAGGQFISITESFDTSTAVGRMVLTIMAGIAEMESEIKSDNALSWHEHRRNVKADDGQVAALPNGGKRPYGYERSRNMLTEIPSEAKHVRSFYAMALETKGNLTAIARESSKIAGAPKEQAGMRWLLRNPAYIGKRGTPEGELVNGCWEGIVDEEIWLEVVELLADPNRKSNTVGNDYRHLLSGFLFCNVCGSRMYPKFHPKGNRYLCRQCNNSINEVMADDAVSTDVLARLDRKAWNELRMAGRTASPAVQAKFEERLATLKRMHDSEEISFEEWVEMRKDVNASLERAATRKAVELPTVDDLHKAWPHFTAKQKRMVIGACLDRVELHANGPERHGERIHLHYSA